MNPPLVPAREQRQDADKDVDDVEEKLGGVIDRVYDGRLVEHRLVEVIADEATEHHDDKKVDERLVDGQEGHDDLHHDERKQASAENARDLLEDMRHGDAQACKHRHDARRRQEGRRDGLGRVHKEDRRSSETKREHEEDVARQRQPHGFRALPSAHHDDAGNRGDEAHDRDRKVVV